MRRFAIFTDLDGTLLDHDGYGCEPARPCIERLTAQGVPIMPVTSKTAAEILLLRQGLGLKSPYVAENGCVLGAPEGYFQRPLPARLPGCLAYAELTELLHGLRSREGYRFRGFADMTTAELAERTGLQAQDAERAARREASEPIVWEDSPSRLAAFTAQLQQHSLHMTEGGRFHHVLGPADKGMAARELMARLREDAPEDQWLSIGLGDAPNDLPMLDSVDIAVVIPSARDFSLEPRAPQVLRPTEPGPRGWAWAVERALAQHGD